MNKIAVMRSWPRWLGLGLAFLFLTVLGAATTATLADEDVQLQVFAPKTDLDESHYSRLATIDLEIDLSKLVTDQDYHVSLVDKNGQVICASPFRRNANVDVQGQGQDNRVRCDFDPSILADGDNSLQMTITDLATNAIMLQTTSHFFYEHEEEESLSPWTWLFQKETGIAAGAVVAARLAWWRYQALRQQAAIQRQVNPDQPILTYPPAAAPKSLPPPLFKPSLPRPPPLPKMPSLKVPSLKMPTLPKAPSLRMPSLPKMPSLKMPSLPKAPSLKMPSLPKLPSLKMPTLPKLPSVKMPTMPRLPNPRIGEKIKRLLDSSVARLQQLWQRLASIPWQQLPANALHPWLLIWRVPRWKLWNFGQLFDYRVLHNPQLMIVSLIIFHNQLLRDPTADWKVGESMATRKPNPQTILATQSSADWKAVTTSPASQLPMIITPGEQVPMDTIPLKKPPSSPKEKILATITLRRFWRSMVVMAAKAVLMALGKGKVQPFLQNIGSYESFIPFQS